MELAERITGRVAELTGEVELLRKQLADAEHELDRLVIAGQVITQLMAEGAPAPAPAHRSIAILTTPPARTVHSPGKKIFLEFPDGRPEPFPMGLS